MFSFTNYRYLIDKIRAIEQNALFSIRMKYTFLTVVLCLIFGGTELYSQAINTPFGKNRVQYHNDFDAWTRYETENFVTYWYGKSRNIAQAVIQMAELDHDEVQKVLEHSITDKIEIIVYIDLTDLKQSNIGLEEAFTNNAGRTKIQGHKMFVYFDGNHLNLRKQIKQGIAQVYLNSILYGSSFQEIVQNALLLNLPNWFGEGIVSYASSPWDYEIDDELRDLLLNEPRYEKFEKFADEHPRAAGHAMWHYIALKYDPATIANLIYLTRINRNLENSFLFILGESFEKVGKDFYEYYISKYSSEKGRFTRTQELDRLKFKNKKGVPLSVIKESPDGKYLAYVINQDGKARLYVRNQQTGEEKKVFKLGSRNKFQEPDYNYPLIAWHPQKAELCVVYEKRDIIRLRQIFIPDGSYEDEDLTQDYQRVYSMEYIDNDRLLFSAAKDGFSDIYIYNKRLRNSERLTRDFYDDLDAIPVNYFGTTAILFRSNREDSLEEKRVLDTILPLNEFDLFLMYNLEDDPQLKRLTNTPEFSEQSPRLYDEDKLMYLLPSTGILNAYVLDIESGEKRAVTNFERNIIIHEPGRSTGRYYFSYYDDGEYKVFSKVIDQEKARAPAATEFRQGENRHQADVFIPFIDPIEEIEATDGMKFQSEFPDPQNMESLDEIIKEGEESSSVFDKYFKDYYSSTLQDGKRIIKYSPMRATASRLKFKLNDFTTRMDNSILFEGLESYTGQDQELTNVPLGLLFKATIKDLFEDYEIQLGLRVPTSFNGYEYFGVFDNKKYLIDKRFAFYRKAETNIIDPESFPVQRDKRHTVLGLYQLRYPFDIYTSLRMTATLRFDKYIRLSVDPVSLNEPFVNEKRLSLKAEYIFDNTLDISLNIKNGTRYKAYIEFINEFDLQLTDGFELDPSKAYTAVFGFDARHYVPILRHAVLALRGAGASSVGSSRIVYYLGGMENWLFNQFDESIPVPGAGGSSYKVLAPHLRGFKNNIRNGNSFLLSNVELRVPVFRFFSRRPTGNGFFKNLQVTGFFDAGFAWYGIGPNAEDNPLNTITVSNPPDNPVVTLDGRYFRDPLVMGYGFGFRTTLLGYYLKFDYAWGLETGQRLDPRYYFSLGMDF